jgi:hypothetical protein
MAKPDGPVVVDPGIELEFLHHLPIELMWGVGPVTGARLAEIGVLAIGAAGKDAGMVARAVARSRGGRETRNAGVEPRPTGNRDASPTPIGRSAVGDRQVFRPTPASCCRQNRHPPPGQVQAWSHRDGPRSLRQPGHWLVESGATPSRLPPPRDFRAPLRIEQMLLGVVQNGGR